MNDVIMTSLARRGRSRETARDRSRPLETARSRSRASSSPARSRARDDGAASRVRRGRWGGRTRVRGKRRARASFDGLGLDLDLDLRRLDHRRGRRRATRAGVGGERGDDGVVRVVGGAGAGRVATRAARRLGGDEERVSSERAGRGDG